VERLSFHIQREITHMRVGINMTDQLLSHPCKKLPVGLYIINNAKRCLQCPLCKEIIEPHDT